MTSASLRCFATVGKMPCRCCHRSRPLHFPPPCLHHHACDATAPPPQLHPRLWLQECSGEGTVAAGRATALWQLHWQSPGRAGSSTVAGRGRRGGWICRLRQMASLHLTEGPPPQYILNCSFWIVFKGCPIYNALHFSKCQVARA